MYIIVPNIMNLLLFWLISSAEKKFDLETKMIGISTVENVYGKRWVKDD